MSTATIDERKYRTLLGKTLPVVIETEREYERMLAAVEALMDKDDDEVTEEEGRLVQLLAVLIEEYEDRHYPILKSPPDKMLRYLLDGKDMKPSDLWPVIGSKSRVSEILSGKRSISKEQAKKLAAFFRAPLELFI